MRGTELTMLLAAALLVVAVAAPGGRESVRPRLQVQMDVEPATGLTSDDLRAIAHDVEQIWSRVVDLVVTPAGVGRALAVDTIRLTITTRTLPAHDTTGLGWIDFVNGEPQPAITVSVAAARQLLADGTWRGVPFSSLPKRASRTFVQRTLARAVAHEIGHYLLRSKTHDRQGLMRAVFTVDEIMDHRDALVRLSEQAMARLRMPTFAAASAGEPGTDSHRDPPPTND
jgi:hypothetical protein